MDKCLEAIRRGEDVRAGLIELKLRCKEDPKAAWALRAEDGVPEIFEQLLMHEDAKVRKNAALLLGELGLDESAQALYHAYEAEQTRFVKSAYLQALKELDVTPYLDALRARYTELLAYEPAAEEQKHVAQERSLLQQLLAENDVIEKHIFSGWRRTNDVIFTTEYALREPLQKQLESRSREEVRTALHPFGVRVRTTELSQLCRLHTYRELLFTLRVKGTIRGTADELSQALLDGGLVTLLEHTHTEDAPFYFRIEVRGVEDTVQKTALAKELAQALEQGSGGKLLNSTTDYEVEVRLTRTKDGSFYPCLKLYTIGDDRFAWRKQTISASMHPSLAAALIELSRPYLSEQAVVLDALCGVGTFVIERNLRMKAYDNYAVDLYGQAIAGAKQNAAAAGVTCNFITKDFTQFTSKHQMTEIFADMPKRGKKMKEELDALYSGCFRRFSQLLAAHGHLFLYAGEEGFVKKNLRLNKELALIHEMKIRPKEDGVFYIIEKRS